MIEKLRRRHPIAVTKRIEQLPVIPIKKRPAIFLPTDVLTYRFKRALGIHGRLLPSYQRSVTDREQPAIKLIFEHGSRGRIGGLVSSCSQAKLRSSSSVDDAR